MKMTRQLASKNVACLFHVGRMCLDGQFSTSERRKECFWKRFVYQLARVSWTLHHIGRRDESENVLSGRYGV